ncbi:AAA family ATPase [Cellulomonas sp. P24]|uniref:helix-turn-helix transcriptional regulator n=1 Tax=Cellulomonas sp. P24 TaxID=2885206 RepID=UPI00286FFD52|nr:AAA family ATPase [Cellulomonas sp. P24]
MTSDTRGGPLVGREDELSELCELLGVDEAVHGSGSVLLGGDAGVGKTRLVQALRERAAATGRSDVVGHCLDFGDSALPYLPFSEIFGRLLAEIPDVVGPVVAAHPSINRLLPGQRVRSGVGIVPSTTDHDDRLRGDRAAQAQSSRADLFESVHAVLEELAERQPLLVVVEDVHWADQASRELISFLFSRPFEAPVALVVTYRSDDVHRRHPLRSAIAEWSRLTTVHRLHLAPLSEGEVRTLIQTLHPLPLPERDIQAIVSRAEGNAFFTEELVLATQMGTRALPNDLADLLLVELDHLDERSRTVVRAAAAAGRQVTHQLLSRVVSVPAPDLDLALRQAVESHILVLSHDDSYAFRHALLAEAIYDDLLPGERVRLHAAYVSVLRSGEVPGTAAELARHARAARDAPTAIRASIEAGDDAMAVGAPEEAARHYEIALELLARAVPQAGGGAAAGGSVRAVGPVEVDDADSGEHAIVGLVLKASDALIASGDPYRSVKLIADHLGMLSPEADPSARVRLLVGLAAGTFLTETDLDPLELTGEAMSLVPDVPPSPLRAEVLSVHAKATIHRLGGQDAARFATQAHDMALSLGLPRVAAEATLTLAQIDNLTGDADAARSRLERVVAQARADGDVTAELRGLDQIGRLHFGQGEFPEALAVCQAADRRARESGRPWTPYGVDARAISAITAYTIGDWDAALRTVDVSGQSPPPMAEALLAAVKLSVLAGRRDPGAPELVEITRAWWGRDGMTALLAGGAAIDVRGDRHEIDDAVAVHDDVIGNLRRLWQGSTIWVQVRLSALVLGQLANHAPRVARSELAALGSSGARFVAAAADVWDHQSMTGPARVEVRAWRARVLAEHLRLRWLTDVDAPAEDDLVRAWRESVAAFEEWGDVYELARSRARLAVVLRAAGDADEARTLADAARATARTLGAETLLAELRGLGGPARTTSARVATTSALTPREREILGLVAQGRSNAEIGRRLFISAKTVSVHISNIMAKLGARGRTEAVAVARRDGVLSD